MVPLESLVEMGTQQARSPYSLKSGVGMAGSPATQSALPCAMELGRIPGVVMVCGG